MGFQCTDSGSYRAGRAPIAREVHRKPVKLLSCCTLALPVAPFIPGPKHFKFSPFTPVLLPQRPLSDLFISCTDKTKQN